MKDNRRNEGAKMKDEGYGTTFREEMKRVMEQPAKGKFKPYNRVQRRKLPVVESLLAVVIFVCFALMIWRGLR